jgi:hypothetical protein
LALRLIWLRSWRLGRSLLLRLVAGLRGALGLLLRTGGLLVRRARRLGRSLGQGRARRLLWLGGALRPGLARGPGLAVWLPARVRLPCVLLARSLRPPLRLGGPLLLALLLALLGRCLLGRWQLAPVDGRRRGSGSRR